MYHQLFQKNPFTLPGIIAASLLFCFLAQAALAAQPVRGVGTMGYGSPAPSAPPRSSYGNTPGNYQRGYEGNSPSPGDPWNREADFKARNYQLRHGAQPEFASPPERSVSSPPATQPLPTLPKPPLPGDADMPASSPGPASE